MAAAKESKVKLERPNRQTVTLFFTLNAGTGDEKGVDRALNIIFTPSEVIVRQISWSGQNNAGKVFSINTDMIRDTVLGTFTDAIDGTVAPMSTFNLQAQVKSQRFWITQDGTT